LTKLLLYSRIKNYDIGVITMKTNGGFLVTKIKQLGDRIFERILSEKSIDAFNGAQGRILYCLWQEDGIPIKTLADKSGLAITSLTTMLERMEKGNLICRKQDESDKRKTLLFLTDKAKALKEDYDSVSDEMGNIYYQGFTDEEILQFEAYLDRIRVNLEDWSNK
jgi:mobile rSAM pair MarR family regulator